MLLTNPFLYRKQLRLAALPTAITVTPRSAKLLLRRRLKAVSTSVTIAPQSADLSRDRVILAQPAAITITPRVAHLGRRLLLKAQAAAPISITPNVAMLQRFRQFGFIKADVMLSPGEARLTLHRVLKASPAALTLTPRHATFSRYQGSLIAEPAAIELIPREAKLTVSRILHGLPSALVISPRPALLLRQFLPWVASPAAITITPRSARLLRRRVLKAVKQSIVLSPKSADLIYTPILDPSFANVSLLLHFNGAGGSTVFTDSGPLGLTVTGAGNAQIDTAQSKFGGSSLLLDGAGDYLSVPAGSQFNFGTGAWTIEMWIRTSQTDATWLIMPETGLDNPNHWSLRYNFTSSGRIDWLERLPTRISAAGTGINDGNWHHLAVTRASNSVRIFVDGTQVGSTYTTSYTYGNSTTGLRIGALGSTVTGEEVAGNIDELRITKGVARYTANFTPPNAPFPNG
ncbi:MAG: LamG domain-containing protein [Hyphomicrobiales bacterium]|nr:MAG: LamG domain-containing protein [Hyphomicrobiales bacterium]